MCMKNDEILVLFFVLISSNKILNFCHPSSSHRTRLTHHLSLLAVGYSKASLWLGSGVHTMARDSESTLTDIPMRPVCGEWFAKGRLS